MPSFIVVTPSINHKQIEKDLRRFPAQAKRVYGKAVQEATERYRDFTKQMRPVSKQKTGFRAKGIPLDLGGLRRSVRKKRLSLLAAGVTIGGDAKKYGAFVHEGTTKMPSRPFFQWALDLGAMKIIDRIFERASKRIPHG